MGPFFFHFCGVSNVCSVPGILWSIAAVVCCISKQKTFEFSVVEYAGQATDGYKYRDSILFCNLCSSTDHAHSKSIL